MDNILKAIDIWRTSGAEEQTLQSLSALMGTDATSVWNELHTRKWLRQGASGRWGLMPRAVCHADKTNTRVSRDVVEEKISAAVERVYAWNTFAHAHGVSSIALIAVWGSVANSFASDHGDIDVCVLWRRSDGTVQPGVAPVSCNLYDRWDVEDAVEQWVFEDSLFSLSGVDQWEVFGLQPDFCANVVFSDDLWLRKDSRGTNLSEWETFSKFCPTLGRLPKMC